MARLSYHPSARIDVGGKPRRNAPLAITCVATKGAWCPTAERCPKCMPRLKERQTQMALEAAAKAVRGRI